MKVPFFTAHTAMDENDINDVEKDQPVISAENDKRKQSLAIVAKTLLKQLVKNKIKDWFVRLVSSTFGTDNVQRYSIDTQGGILSTQIPFNSMKVFGLKR